MPEPLTTELVRDVIDQLLVAFPRAQAGGPDTRRTVEVYRNALSGVSGDGLRHAARVVIQTEDKYFPKVAKLREIASAFDQRNHATPDRVTDPMRCPLGHRLDWLQRWRPRTNEEGRVLVNADGTRFYLERYERLLCPTCSPASAFAPDGDTLPANMAVKGSEVFVGKRPWTVAPFAPRESEIEPPKQLAAGGAP